MSYTYPSEQTRNLARKITDFYFDKAKDIRKCTEQISSLKIQKIDFNEEKQILFVHLCRPGLLMGRKGDNINQLSEFLGIRIEVVESFDWESFLIPLDYDALEGI